MNDVLLKSRGTNGIPLMSNYAFIKERNLNFDKVLANLYMFSSGCASFRYT